MAEKISFPEPDEVLTEKPSLKKYLRYLLFFGPGAIIASATIGQGQLILGPQIGAWAGFNLLWIISLSIGSYILAYVAARFTLLSGINMVDLFAVKTKKGFLNWVFIIIIVVFLPFFAAAIITTLGKSLEWIFGFGNYLAWGIAFSIIALAMVLAGRYKVVEHTQAFFVAVLAVGAIASIIAVKPDILQIFPHFFVIDIPEYPAWVPQNVKATPVPLIMLGYMGTLTITIITFVGYSGWLKVKRWGIFKGKEDPEKFSRSVFELFEREGKINYLPDDKNEIKKARLLLKPSLVDLSIAFVVVAVVSSAYMLAGTYLLGPKHVLPSDVNLIKEQAVIFSSIAEWLVPLYKISVFFALFGTIYAGFEAASRMLYETMGAVVPKIRNVQYKKFMVILSAYLLGVGIPLALSGISIILMLSITLLFIGVVGVIIYGTGAVYFSQKILPPEYKMGKVGTTIAILSILFLAFPLLLLLFI